ncbi:ZIP family metal transporter [Candidatus Pacearchaeota archaeon]|nr:ZIP family metal transporter [Candidatus Pacearchaeota archaeon]
MTLSTLSWIILMTIINGFIAFAGAFTLLISRKNLKKILLILVSFSIGALLGGAFFHLIPEALENLSILKTIIILLIGIIIFYLIEKYLHWHHCHKEGKCKQHPYTHLILYGDGLHNFIDGLIIASSFIISIPFGILTSLLIILHELPQEVGDFAILVYGGFTKKKALLYNFLAQLTAVLGGILGYFYLGLQNYAIYLLPFAAGGFIYIAVKDLIPEVFKERDKIKIIQNIIAIILGLLILISAKIFI